MNVGVDTEFGRRSASINKTINKLDEYERNINTLLFGNDQLHLETNKKIFAIVHDFFIDFFGPNRPLVNLSKSAKICSRYKRRSTF